MANWRLARFTGLSRRMILIGIGANLPSPGYGSPRETCAAALAELGRRGVRVLARSRWYESAPVPPGPAPPGAIVPDSDIQTAPDTRIGDDPWYVNAVVRVATALPPGPLLALMHGIEADFGRVRGAPGVPRVLDLDLLDYQGRIQAGDPVAANGPAANGSAADGPPEPVLPHPRMAERAFVLLPLAEIAPEWRHPALGQAAARLAAALPPGQVARPIE